MSNLTFPMVCLGVAASIALYSLFLDNPNGLETAKVLAAIGGTSYQTEANLRLRLKRGRELEEIEETDNART